ncbi:macro domain-containing protein [Erythrobacter oryzae]|uniref:macro domain-containing protein n=1 Tax=Erythrobacter oryzae TaxID=3019556 RepID=UPI0025551A80|nr:macro domain-containing protein [Erythrobacter sp. COR-2]
MAANVAQSFLVGIRRRWLLGLSRALSAVGGVWLLTEIGQVISDDLASWLKNNGQTFFALVFLAALLGFLSYVYEPRKITFKIPTIDSYITIKFGDIFAEDANWLFSVNEFFDSRLGDVISSRSVHGQFITKIFAGDEIRFRAAVDTSLRGTNGTDIPRPGLPSTAYKIGTTAILQNGSRRAFLVALSKTDLRTHKAYADVPMLWDAMTGGLESVLHHGSGDPLAMPLMGNGLSGINVDPQHLLRLITLRLVDYGRKYGIPKQVRIIVHDDCFEHIDLREIKRDWMTR